MKIQKDDKIIIISGKDRGRKGKVLKTFPKKGRVSIEGLNLVKKHRRPRKSGEKGQIISVPAPIDISNIKLVCPKCSKPTGINFEIQDKKKLRICKKCKTKL